MAKTKSKAMRAPNGNGSIRQKANGTWEGRYTLGRHPGTGKQIQKSIYGKTQAEVVEKMHAISLEITQGTYIEQSKLTVAEWFDIWLEEYSENLKPYTIASYRATIKNHIKPNFGALKLDKVTPHYVQQFYNSLTREKKLSAKTVKNIHGVFHKAMEKAVRLDYIRSNPSQYCTLPKIVKKEIKPLEEHQIKEFLKACEAEQFKELYIITLFTGMRQSEILGLSWNDIDLTNGTITLKRQLQQKRKLPNEADKGKGVYYFTTLKNGKPRTITVAPFITQLFKDIRLKQNINKLMLGRSFGNGDKLNTNLVFTDELGCHLKHGTVYEHYKAIVKSIGIEDARFHDLRHTYAVTSLQNGDDVKTVQENLGHATASFTLDVYGHVTEKMRKESANRMENYYNSIAK